MMTEDMPPLSETELRAANVNPRTGLATDYLNLFNEYIMLAELVSDGSMEHDILLDWQPMDYEGHFVHSGFRGVETVVSAFRALDEEQREHFENDANMLLEMISCHQTAIPAAPCLTSIKLQRDVVASLISGSTTGDLVEIEDSQASIDALFD